MSTITVSFQSDGIENEVDARRYVEGSLQRDARTVVGELTFVSFDPDQADDDDERFSAEEVQAIVTEAVENALSRRTH